MSTTSLRDQLLHSARPIIVDVWAPWCLPCRTLSPMLEQARRQYGGRVEVIKLNADESPEEAQALGVLGIPTLVVFRNGQEIARRTGLPSPEELNALFEAALSGQAQRSAGPSRADRALRLFAALVLFGLGVFTGPSWVLLAVSALVAFSAVYDRCPLWRAIRARLQGAGSGS
ncbi:MAG: thioredoxin domain-containing protein [Anaerolineales bacterium]|nr:thioredoxin domain-containing protein [Anaerolineales bacterium]